MNLQEAVEKTIRHWERMTAWVFQCNPEDRVDAEKMELALGESWYAKNCALCQYVHENYRQDEDCSECMLAQKCINPSSPWYKLNYSKTWRAWQKYAYILLTHLRSLKD